MVVSTNLVCEVKGHTQESDETNVRDNENFRKGEIITWNWACITC